MQRSSTLDRVFLFKKPFTAVNAPVAVDGWLQVHQRMPRSLLQGAHGQGNMVNTACVDADICINRDICSQMHVVVASRTRTPV